jgi:hypothetical protein
MLGHASVDAPGQVPPHVVQVQQADLVDPQAD